MARPATKRKRTAAPGSRKHLLLPAAAIILTFLVRLLFILEIRGHPFSVISAQVVDSYYYHRWALEILSGNFWGSEVFFLRPLYPYLLALVYAVFGRGNLLWVQLLQTAMAAASCFLLYDSTRRIFNRTSALIAGFGFALTGILVFYTGALLYVELTVLLSLLTVWLMLVAGRHWWRWLLAGISFGLMVICRPELLLLLPLFLLFLRRKKVKFRNLGTMAAAALLVIVLVPIRNLLIAGDPVLFTAHSGINFYYGNNPSADGTWQPAGEIEDAAGFSHDRLKQTARTVNGREVPWSRASNHWMRKGLDFLVSNSGPAVVLIGRKFLLFWGNYEVPNNYYPETARASSLFLRLAFINFGLLAAFGVIGMVLAWNKRSKAWPAYLFVAAYLFSSLAFYVLSRLRAPVIPFLLMLGGFGLHEITRLFRSHKPRQAMPAFALGLAVLVGSILIPVKKSTYSAQAWTQVGNIHLNHRKIGPALNALHRALEADPDNPSARYSLLVSYAGAGKTEKAEAEYRRLAAIVVRDPRNRILGLLGAARIAIAHRSFPEAVRLYRAAIEQDPSDPEKHFLLGLVYVSMDSLLQARVELDRAVDLDPAHGEAHSALEAVESHLRR